MPDISMVHVDMALTNESIQYRNTSYVAEEVFPSVPVPKQSNKYYIYSQDRLRPEDDARRPGAKANEIDWTLSTDTYFAEGHAMAQAIPDEERANQDPALDMDVDATDTLTDKILLNREVLAASIATSSSVVTQHTSGSAWDTPGSNPITDIETAKSTIQLAIAKPANRMILSWPVFSKLRLHPSIRAALGLSNPSFPGNISAALLAQAFEIEKVIVADCVKITSAEGVTSITKDWIWGKNALLYHSEPAGLRTMSLGRMYRWLFGANTAGWLVKRYRVEGRTADVVEVQSYHDAKVVVPAAAYLFDGCVS